LSTESVAVIIPTYDRHESTLRAIRSALYQSLPPNEIFVIDDGSRDEILVSLEKSIIELGDRRVILVKSDAKRHPGVIRNIGIAAAKSNWIAFLDSDDVWTLDKLEIQLSEMKVAKSLASCTLSIHESNGIDGPKTHDNCVLKTKHLLKINQIINSSVLISSELLKSVGGVVTDFSVRGVEDYATWLRVSVKSEWLLVNRPLVYYSQNSPDSIRNDSMSTKSLDVTYAHLNFVLWKSRSLTGQIKIKILKEIVRLIAQIKG
jgi:glycosyltransferase involved in cell wall biosynthesis